MPKFDVEFAFSMRCVTRGYTIEAATAEEAEKKAEACITKEGDLDFKAFTAAGGDANGSWDTRPDEVSDYDVVDVTLSDDQDEDEPRADIVIGGSYHFEYPYTSQDDHAAHSGQTVTVVRALTADEADAEVGPMFVIRAADGWEAHAYAVELTPTTETATA